MMRGTSSAVGESSELHRQQITAKITRDAGAIKQTITPSNIYYKKHAHFMHADTAEQ